MEQSFWQERWEKKETGFNEGVPNASLVKFKDKLGGPPKRTLVPLAGKAFDLRWLADQGHDVVGVEFVPEAIRELFKEWGEKPIAHRLGAHDALYAKGVTMIAGDIFSVTPASLNTFDLIYDRAALVALAPADEARYAAAMRALLKPGGGIFLITFSYDQSKVEGPPWSVDDAQVHALYAGMTIERLGDRQLPANFRLQGLGVPFMTETAYWIT